jgi:hypothetical protein
MVTTAILAGAGVVVSLGIVYQNYIQNATTRREVEQDLRDKLLEDKGWEGSLFSVSFSDLRVHEDTRYRYKTRRLLTRKFRADTQVSLACNGIIVEDDELDWIEDELESTYGFEVSIYFSELEDVYQVRLGTTHESDIAECIGDLHRTVDEHLTERKWEFKEVTET